MEFKKIQLNGFKSFAEKTNFLIEDGLTGIVGPNGCGKSNIVESLRWCMGENSAKSMRGSGMEDVIFSGTSNRPSKNISEVTLLLDNQNKKMSEIISELPNTFQTPTMAPFCKDEEKYIVVEELVKQIKNLKENKTEIDGQIINDILTVNGVRFSFEDGSWGLIRASSNKPSLVVVTESPTSDERKKKIFDFIDDLLQKTGKIGEYDQKI